MNNLKAKFKVGSVVNFGNNNVEANLSAVTATTEENKSFSIYTPMATVKIHITNPDALDFFEPGSEYVATFTKAEKEQKVITHDFK